MKQQPCVVLSGHGFYNKSYIYDLSIMNVDYNIIFLNEVGVTHPNAQHNLLLKSLSKGLTITDLESLPTTFVANKTAPKGDRQFLINMEGKLNPYVYEHYLKNSHDNVKSLSTLVDIDDQRFISQNKVLVDYKVRTTWHNAATGAEGSLMVQCDREQIKRDVLQAYINNAARPTINLSSNNLLYITPVATPGDEIKIELSSILTDILPKIKIPVLFHKFGKQEKAKISGEVKPPSIEDVKVNMAVFLDDGTFGDKEALFFPKKTEEDIYHEVAIGGDANIIWDACRDPL